MGGLVGALTGILVSEAITSEKNTLTWAAGALLSAVVAGWITNKLYNAYLKSTSTSRAAIDDTAKLLKNRG